MTRPAAPSILLSAAPPPSGSLVSAWVVIPAAVFLLLVLGAHMNSLTSAQMPASRRRIRVANAWLMLFTIPILAYAFGAASPSNTRLFVMTWLLVVALLASIILLAGLDMLNTQRLHRAEQRTLRRQIHDATIAARATTGPPTPPPPSPMPGDPPHEDGAPRA